MREKMLRQIQLYIYIHNQAANIYRRIEVLTCVVTRSKEEEEEEEEEEAGGGGGGSEAVVLVLSLTRKLMTSLETDDSTLSESCSSTSPGSNTNSESSGEMKLPRKAVNKKLDGKGVGRTKKIAAKNPSHTRDPVMADQQKRKRVSKHFMALSSTLPGLKKTDETSILEDAIQYLKQLRERVDLLEDQLNEKSGQESTIFEEITQLSSTDGATSCEKNNGVPHSELGVLSQLPEIEAKAQDKNVLIRIHCEKENGHLSKILNHVETLHLAVVNMCALPFGDHFLDITIVAQMGNEFCMAMKDLERNLGLALLSFAGTCK